MDGDRNVMTMASLKDWVLEAMSQHRFGEAEKTLRTALESPLQNTDLQFLLGTVLASSGKLDEAIHYLEEVRKALPNNVSVLNNLGNVLRLRGRVEEAVTHLRHALTVHSDSPDVLINLGLCLTTLGRGDQAVQCARLALRLRPQVPRGNVRFGHRAGRDRPRRGSRAMLRAGSARAARSPGGAQRARHGPPRPGQAR